MSVQRNADQCVAQAAQAGAKPRVCSTDQFMLLSCGDPAQDRATGQFLAQVYERFTQSFTQAGFSVNRPSDKLIVLCLGSYDQLDAYGRLADNTEASWMDAYYSMRTNRVAFVRQGGRSAQTHLNLTATGVRTVAAQPGSSGRSNQCPAYPDLNPKTVTHELAHLLAFNTGLQNRAIANPFWLTEGLATNFEAGPSGTVGLGQTSSNYDRRLASAKAGGRVTRLDRFIGMTEITSGSGEATLDAYAQAWGLFHFLLESRRGQLIAYMRDLASPRLIPLDGQGAARRFVAAFGPIDQVEAEFLRFIDHLPAAPGNAAVRS